MPAARQLPLRHRLRRVTRPAFLGTLRSSGPLSDNFGFDRGTPVDRYYIERFLYDNRADIRAMSWRSRTAPTPIVSAQASPAAFR